MSPWVVALASSAFGLALALGFRHGGEPPLPARVRRATLDPVRACETYVDAWTRARPQRARAVSRGAAAAHVDAPAPWGVGVEASLEVTEVHEGDPIRVLGVVVAGTHAQPVACEVQRRAGQHYVQVLQLVDAGTP